LYKVKFSRLGENLLTVNFGAAKSMVLEFFVTESLETLIKKRAAFLAAKQLHRDPTKWYNGLFSDWDMGAKTRGLDDKDGLKDYWLASDDPGLCKAPYLAEKRLSPGGRRDRPRVSPQELRLGKAVHGQREISLRHLRDSGLKVNRERSRLPRLKDHCGGV
jgi:hypothetical protein